MRNSKSQVVRQRTTADAKMVHKSARQTKCAIFGIVVMAHLAIICMTTYKTPSAYARLTSAFDAPLYHRGLLFLARNDSGYTALEDWLQAHSDPFHPAAFQAPHLTVGQINTIIQSKTAFEEAHRVAQAHGWECRWDGGDVAECASLNPYPLNSLPSFNKSTVRHASWQLLEGERELEVATRTHLANLQGRVGGNLSENWVVPQTVAESFNVSWMKSLKGTIGVIEFQDGAHYCPSDLTAFRDLWQLPQTPVSHIGPFPSGNCPSEGESSLDIQWIVGSAPGASRFDYYNAPNWIPTGAYMVYNATNLTDILSVSYGYCERCQTQILPGNLTSQEIVQLSNDNILKSVARGTSWVVASGDSGCKGRCFIDCSGPACCTSFPASSPYVTAVGALDVLSDSVIEGGSCGTNMTCSGPATDLRPSVSPNDGWSTGGGASNFTTMPPWQQVAVEMYLDRGLHLPPGTNTGGRFTADISAPGHLVQVVMDGNPQTLDGTSASTPIVAGWLLHLSELFAATPRGRIGFANPMLYAIAATCPECTVPVAGLETNDCTEETCCAGFGFNSTRLGWDPLTGVKPLNVQNSIEWIQNLLDHGKMPIKPRNTGCYIV